MVQEYEEALREHEQLFGQEGRSFVAPARVNLIGEHTDYTGGFVMPMAIGFHTSAAISARNDEQAVIYSANYEEKVVLNLATLDRYPLGHWSDYPTGVLWSLLQEGVEIGGVNINLVGDVPLGAGLSSSASVEVATAMALLNHANVQLPLEKIANLCRRAENEFVGAKSGIMDQFVVAGAVANRAMLLDCRSLKYELLPLPDEVKVVICNSMVKHAVATGEYGNRRDEVEAGQAALRRRFPRVELLRDATLQDLDACREDMSEESFARCRHIITENIRVLRAREALLQRDLVQFGRLMVDAHASMRDDFAASCNEVDALVAIATRQDGCLGARITGGGFGGCTVNLVAVDHVERFVTSVGREYEHSTGILADCYVCAPSDGALAMTARESVR
ncbi:galactokinase [Granulicella sp. WH15]|nr:galactokinase [Granulicella sp. WH15]